MSCGLGAIILVFMLVKYNVDTSVPENDWLRGDIDRLYQQESDLRNKISALQAGTEQAIANIQSVSERLAQIQAQLTAKQSEISAQQDKLTALKETIKKTEVAKPSDVVDDPQAGEEDYVIGLKVEGSKVGILLDASASMTDEILIDVIRRKNGSDGNKMKGPKWQRAKRIVRWLLARLPNRGSVAVVAYRGKAEQLGGKRWVSSRDPNALGTIFRELDAVVPEGPTNLEAGLNTLSRLRPSNIYIITDGLPTVGDSDYRSLNPFAECSSLWGKSNRISGRCRLKLFQHTLVSSSIRSGVPINVILLPIGGDPDAARAYWSWSAVTGGLMISPAASWP